MDGFVLEKKSALKMLDLSFTLKLNLGSFPVSIAKTTTRKVDVLIHSM